MIVSLNKLTFALYYTAKLSEETNRKLPARNTLVQLLALYRYTDPESHNAQRPDDMLILRSRPTGTKKQESLANAKYSVRQPCTSKTDFDVKLALKVILGHLFCNQLQADKG